MKVIDFIEKFDGTIDVYDNYTEELAIAYCGQKLTEEGKKHFEEALQLPIDYIGTSELIIQVDAEGLSEKKVEHRLEIAKDLFEAMAGYCSPANYDKWFKD